MLRLSIASLGEEPIPRFIDLVKLAELLGYHAFFHADEKWTRDVYVRQATAAAHTKRLGLGISVTDPFTRHPALTAQATATLSEVSEGRLRVVMGAGSHFETMPGYAVVKPVVAIREAIELMRRLWAGERVTLDGQVIKYIGGKLDFDPAYTPDIYVASRGPKIFEMAGQIADGVLMGSFATKGGVNYAREHIGRGLEKAGRDWSDITLAAWVYVSILDDEEEPIPENIRRGVSHALWSSRALLADLLDDLADDITPEFRRFMKEAPHEWSPEIMAELRSLIPRGLFDSLAIVGTEKQVIEKFKMLESLGVQEAIIWPFNKEGEEVEDLIIRLAHKVLPHVQGEIEREAYRLVD